MLPLSLIETDFQARAGQTVLDGNVYEELPNRLIGAAELRALLLDQSLSHDTNDAIWAHLVTRLRRESDQALRLICLGLALPGLHHAVARARLACYDAERADLEAEAIAGFLAAAGTVDLHRNGVCGRLCQAAHTAARSLARNTGRYQLATDATTVAPERSPAGHVDLVLVYAVLEGVITEEEARLIGATRLDGKRLAAIARSAGNRAFLIGIQRRRAEERLRTWLSQS